MSQVIRIGTPVRTVAKIGLLGLLAGLGLSSSAWGTAKQLEIRKFRFSKHKSFEFERLVIEFRTKTGGNDAPLVKLVTGAGPTEASVVVNQVELVGAIPEAAINDSYDSKSEFLGPISINTDDPNRDVAVRVFVRDPKLKVDAFWLNAPARLVVDAYPEDSARSRRGRFVAQRSPSRGLASVDSENEVICYPAASQLVATVRFFQNQEKRPDDHGYTHFGSSNPNGPIVCFPAKARVVADVGFQQGPVMGNQFQSQSYFGNLGQAYAQPQSFQAPAFQPPAPTENRAPAQVAPQAALPPPPKIAGQTNPFGNQRAGGSTLNAGGFSQVTPLGAKLGAEGPEAPKVDPKALLLPNK